MRWKFGGIAEQILRGGKLDARCRCVSLKAELGGALAVSWRGKHRGICDAIIGSWLNERIQQGYNVEAGMQ